MHVLCIAVFMYSWTTLYVTSNMRERKILHSPAPSFFAN